MSLDSILLFAPAETSAGDVGPAAHAIVLAKSHRARLTAFVVNLDVTTPKPKADAAAVADQIQAAAQAAGVECVAVTEHSHAIGIHEVVAEHARLHDLTVIGSNADGLLSERIVLEHLLFDSGRPLIAVPRNYRADTNLRTAVVAWDNTAAAARALGDAKPLLHGCDVIFLTISGDKQLHGDLSPTKVNAANARRGLKARSVTAELGGRNIGEALQEEAAAHGAGLLILGGFGHSRFRRFVLGSATAGILDDLRLPVLMSH